ncbi:MAG: Crp/Fnr family transcriptional regulator, partial [Bdellovibrionales bacterium]|nr:Crp/Fnr family transcriptional regulator [Bdellovibrionales bacterium]
MIQEVRNLIEKNGTEVSWVAGQGVFSEGDECRQFLVLREGIIKVFKTTENGREYVLYRVNPENLCVLTSSCILSDVRYSASAITETNIKAWVLSKANFGELILKSKEFREFVFSSLSYRFEQFVRKIDEVITSNLKDQVFTFLCERQNSFGEIIITHQELAKEFGTEREVISRILATLKKSGKVLLSK